MSGRPYSNRTRWVLLQYLTVAYVHNVFMLPHSELHDRRIGVEPALLIQTMRTFITRLVDVYRDTLTHMDHRASFLTGSNFEDFPSCLFAAPRPEFRPTNATRFLKRIHPDRRASCCGPPQ